MFHILYSKCSIPYKIGIKYIDNSAAAKDGNNRKTLGFVRAGVQTQTDGGVKVTENREDIELPEESDSDGDDEKVEIVKKDVPSEVFGGLVRKRVDSRIMLLQIVRTGGLVLLIG
ncbi:unnamed protein product [Linum trigynum]|uniref:Uncharacterized protein n=1 Tax=Linum trigynum TaxID=586398 RepID=A0AAV2FFN6_9ROSI